MFFPNLGKNSDSSRLAVEGEETLIRNRLVIRIDVRHGNKEDKENSLLHGIAVVAQFYLSRFLF